MCSKLDVNSFSSASSVIVKCIFISIRILRDLFHPRESPATFVSIFSAETPQIRLPFLLDFRGFRGLPVIRIPRQLLIDETSGNLFNVRL